MNNTGLRTADKLMHEFLTVFWIKLGPSGPAHVELYDMNLRKGYWPCRATQRKYGEKQRKCIEATITSLEKIGAVRRNKKAQWESPALAVLKPETGSLRFTIDFRGVNREPVLIVSAMPDLEMAIASIGGSTVFAKLEMVHAYWQIPLHADTQEKNVHSNTSRCFHSK